MFKSNRYCLENCEFWIYWEDLDFILIFKYDYILKLMVVNFISENCHLLLLHTSSWEPHF